ncbi:Phospho-N-acetylmuramoyl-pentapeptide-transferase [Bertholletia excelsa]
MRSHSSAANGRCFNPVGLFWSSRARGYSLSLLSVSSDPAFRHRRPSLYFGLKLSRSVARKHGFQPRIGRIRAMGEDVSSFDDWGNNNGVVDHMLSPSEGEESDGEDILNPVIDVDLPTAREQYITSQDATAHRFAMLRRKRRKSRIFYGVINNVGLTTFLTMLLLFVDWCAWRIVRLPLETFYLMRPFCTSAIVVSCIGYVGVPILRSMKIHSIIRKEGHPRHSTKKGTPIMAVATLAFATIGLLDDVLSLKKNHNSGLSAWMKIFLEVAVGSLFSFWLSTTKISSPYSMKMLVPLPAPLGLVSLGKFYLLFTSFCFVSMANGINLVDGLDGLAGGVAALAFVGMSIAVLPICSDLAIFGASMAGACIGFLSHNRYKASVSMGDTGSLALGAALAAMASCTGMFLPLLISSGIFILEAVSVITQVSFFGTTKCLWGTGHSLFRMAPLHHHLELCGIKEPIIVAGAYFISSALALYAGYLGLISA